MTLDQKQQTLTTAIAEMQNFMKNANISNDETGTQLILDSIVLVGEDYTKSQEARDYHQEQEGLVFDVINGVNFEDEDNITLDELGEIQQELENALEDLQEPSTLEEKQAVIKQAIEEVQEYIDNGDQEATEAIKPYWINKDGKTFDYELFKSHYFTVIYSELTAGQQEYIFDLIQQEPVFHQETIDHEYIDGIVDKLQEELEELETA